MKKNQVVVAKSLVDVNAQGGRVLLRMLNPADKPRTVYKDAIAAWCEPVEEVVEPGGTCSGSTPSEVRSFLGLCSYYRRFVQGSASIAAPLYRLTEKAGAFKWSEECEDAFRHLKQVLMEAPILAYPNTTASFILDTDASNHGIG